MTILFYIFVQFILHIGYFAISGVKDAVLWSRTGTEAFDWDEHIIFMIERTAVFLIAAISVLFGNILYEHAYYFLGTYALFWLCFPFFHNGAYYLFRNLITPGVYLKGWFDMSTTSTAKINFSVFNRIFLFGLGLGGIVGLYFIAHG